MSTTDTARFASLDGWRGISILLVLASHLLPLGPSAWNLNVASGMLGMVFFFNLSGFLVTHFLINHAGTFDFLVRRFFRIVPLAWTFMFLALVFQQVDGEVWRAHFLFYANSAPPLLLTPVTEHLWSVCMEVQFYVGVALLHLAFKKRGLWVLPILCVAVTAYRILHGEHFSSQTWYRADEILAGATLALIYSNEGCAPLRRLLQKIHPLYVLPFLLLSCHPAGGFIDYLRPYFGMLMVGNTLLNRQSFLTTHLDNRILVYVASISYALYVIHPALAQYWIDSSTFERYAARPLLFIILFLLAHISTRYFEQPCIALGKRVSTRFLRGAVVPKPLLEK